MPALKASSPVNTQSGSMKSAGTMEGQISAIKCSKHTALENLQPRIDADGTPSHMFDFSWDILAKAGLVLGQHF